MAVTININNLSLCHKGSNGISTATIPDVCKTPSPGGPVPIPYPNIAMSMDLMKGTTTVKADGGMMCANYGSEFFKSTGDEPGVVGGVASSTFIKEATWITFSFDVKFQGKAACRLTDKMFHNHQNTVNMGGEIQLAQFVADANLNLLCNIFCEALKAGEKWKKKNPGKKFNYSAQAKKLGEGKYASNLAKAGMKAEKSLLVKVTKQLAEKAAKAGRKTMTKKVIAKKLLKKAAAKIGAKLIPGVNVISTIHDVYEIGSFLKGWASGMKTVTVKPDVAVFNGGKATDIYDYKFPGDRYRKHQDEIFKEATGKKPKTVDKSNCNNCKKAK